MFGVLLTLCTSTFAAPATEWPVDIHVMTMEERAEMQDQAGDKVTIGTAYLSKNNTSGTNGNICSPFTAEKTGMAFVLINARVLLITTSNSMWASPVKESASPTMPQ